MATKSRATVATGPGTGRAGRGVAKRRSGEPRRTLSAFGPARPACSRRPGHAKREARALLCRQRPGPVIGGRHAAHWRSKVPGGSEGREPGQRTTQRQRGLRARAGAQPFVGGRLVIAPQRAQVHSLWRKPIRRRACMSAQGLAGSRGFDDPRRATRNPGRSQRLATYGSERSGPPGPARVTALHSFNSFRLELMVASLPGKHMVSVTVVRSLLASQAQARQVLVPDTTRVPCAGKPVGDGPASRPEFSLK